MTYRGYVKNGVVILEAPGELPDGTQVRVEPLSAGKGDSGEGDLPTLYERLEPFVGKAQGLPPDMSVNLDHYLYGVPKKP
ncbi:MAG: hypothetical protein HQ567_13970 [Candidatus Nealsonbacteria bacterium]|nr:hypothetical protein [Candidatus Nealsonbacteria bacterium]